MFRIMTTWPFLISLATLLSNDWWLKAAFPNILTGKLSDFAGVAVVALLLFSCMPHRKRLIGLMIPTAFLWWKSPLSDSFIHFINSMSAVQIGRAVDYSDLLALIVIPACLYVTQEPARFHISLSYSRRIVTVPLAAATIFAIMGTSVIPTRQQYVVQPISSSVTIPPEGLVNAIAEVAAKHGLTCESCASTPKSAKFVGKGLSMSYIFTANNTVSFTIEAYPNGLFFGKSGEEKADALRTSLKSLLADRFDGLEYVEPLRPMKYRYGQ